jgi:hypothetical protein
MNDARRLTTFAIRDRLPLLLVAAAIVGVAISIDGNSRRLVNGIGALVWVIAAVRIGMQGLAMGVRVRQILLVTGVILVLSWLIRPSDPLWAAIGFGWGGILVGWVGRDLGSTLGALLGALWLPAHLVIAISRSVVRNLQNEPAALRSDPPPTAVLVPLIMVACAWVFAALAAEWRNERESGRGLQPRSPVRPRQRP